MVLEVTESAVPLLLIILGTTEVMPPLPVFEAKEIVATGPLPEKAVPLMMAIFMMPDCEVLDASIAPVTRLP
jgi:hypothetical protein